MSNSVKTTSAPKVRKKIYQNSSEVWKHYDEYLHPLVNGVRK